MWTKVTNFSLVIFLIAGFIYSIVLANSTGWVLWWIMPLGWVVTFLSASTIGTLIEISNKASENQELLVKIITQLQSDGQSDASGSSSSLLSRLKSDVPSTGSAEPWRCPDCGEVNDKNATFCKSCGRYK